MSITRIIYTGKNRDFPKTIRLPYGVCIDGTVGTMLVQIAADECKCRACDGWGRIDTWEGPGHRGSSVRCDKCDGEGIVKMGELVNG